MSRRSRWSALIALVVLGAAAPADAQLWKPRKPRRGARVAPPPKTPSTKPPAPRPRPKVAPRPRTKAGDDFVIIEEDGDDHDRDVHERR